MKHILFIGALLVASTFTCFSQQSKTIVGKWKFAKVVADGMIIDIDNPEATKKELSKKMEDESGQKPDPAMVDMAMEMMMSAFKDSYMEFKADGKVKMSGTMGQQSQVEEATYKVDYKAGTITTTNKNKKVETIKFKFVGNNLVLDTKEGGKTVVMTLKPAK
jgi:hypothetical protein